jgi:hypothetical protein
MNRIVYSINLTELKDMLMRTDMKLLVNLVPYWFGL